MAFYDELEGILNTSTLMLLENQNLCKLLYYYPKEVDLKYNPLSQPNIPDTSKLLLENIFPLPKSPDADTKQNCFIDVTVVGGDKTSDIHYRKVYICFDIICHLDSWIIKGGFRPLKIVQEIDKMFNYQNTKLETVNKPISKPLVAKDYSNKFYGYQLCYELILNSNMDCGA